MVVRRSSCTMRLTLRTISGLVLVESRPLRSSSSRDIRPFLNRECHSKHLARLIASSPYAGCSMSKASVADFLSFTQNLMLALCSRRESMTKSQSERHKKVARNRRKTKNCDRKLKRSSSINNSSATSRYTPVEGEYASLVSQAQDSLTHGSIARETVSELFDRTSYMGSRWIWWAREKLFVVV